MIGRAAWTLACCALCACAGETSQSSPRREALEALTANVFLPMLADFEHAAEGLAQELDRFCAGPDEPGLSRAREAWQTARASWEQAEVLSFGPHSLLPWRLAPRIDFWPARPDSVEEVLAGGVDLGNDAALDGVGAAAKGLPVLEYLLFAPAGDGAALARFGADAAGERSCQYLRALGSDLHTRAGELFDAWSDRFAAELTLDAGPLRYESISESFGEVVNNLAFTVEVARDEKLGKPLGQKSGGEPKPEAVASRFSDRSIEDLRDNLQGVESVFTGRYREHSGPGVAAVLDEQESDKQAAFAQTLALARDALDAVDRPLREAVVDDPPRVEAAIEALRGLLIFVQVDLAQALSVTVTFGGADGD